MCSSPSPAPEVRVDHVAQQHSPDDHPGRAGHPARDAVRPPRGPSPSDLEQDRHHSQAGDLPARLMLGHGRARDSGHDEVERCPLDVPSRACMRPSAGRCDGEHRERHPSTDGRKCQGRMRSRRRRHQSAISGSSWVGRRLNSRLSAPVHPARSSPPPADDHRDAARLAGRRVEIVPAGDWAHAPGATRPARTPAAPEAGRGPRPITCPGRAAIHPALHTPRRKCSTCRR